MIMKLDPFNYNTTRKSTAKKGFNLLYESQLADKHIKHCTQCNRCWELSSTFRINQKNGKRNMSDFISYYVNFPTYGKKKQQCHQCKKESK